MRLTRRLLTAERALGGPHFVSWAEFHTASERMREVLTAKMRAHLQGKPEPDYPERDADMLVINQWRKQVGAPEPDYNEISAKLLAEMRTLSGNPNWDWRDAPRPERTGP